ncbi:MAG: cupredoxin domain-containing protein, partial [Nitrospirota bacterium]
MEGESFSDLHERAGSHIFPIIPDLQRRVRGNVRPSLLLWVIGFLVLQVSCESGGPPTIIVTAEEFRFSPTRIEWVSDQPLRLLIRNQGRERHVFHSQELFGPEAKVLWHQPRVALQEANAVVLEPGQSIELSFTASAGLYPFRCWIKG